MAIWHERLRAEMERDGRTWQTLAKYVGVSTASTTKWKLGHTKRLEGENLLRVCKFLAVSPDWLMGNSPIRSRVSNMSLVKDEPTDSDVLIPQYQDVSLAAGSGSIATDEMKPSDYMTFKRSWLSDKWLSVESLIVVYARGDSMEDRIQSGDVVLVNTDWNQLKDGCIYAFSYSGLATLKRIRLRANGSISLVSDNDPHQNLVETIQPDTLDELNIIGQAVWVGGDLI